ncbi:ABC transporter ATP-binding protein [Allorhizocola rhizosphaerae]|uniref:ABC transporter ATP-binding protein n=1 Tax=Allorhizocola rhizosphaerae TaxID=1872709 RepID=UPI000E3D61D5|nr:ABC transporter ATP-binding protein [Allorhizocola rhizosphaerae]
MSRRVASACALAVAAAPAVLAGYLALALTSGALPVAAAWLTKLIVDGLVGSAPMRTVIGLGAGLGVAGMLTAAVPPVTRYLRGELDRRVGLLAQDRLFAAVDRFVGLDRFEDPRFVDRLRLAQQAGGMTPNQAVDGVVGLSRAVLTVGGFLGSLFVLSPLMTALVLGAGVPVLLAEIALSRRRAKMYWDIGPAERREFFYRHLLSSVEGAKEVRLFGTGALLRGRMLADMGAVHRAKRAVDRRGMAVQAGFGVLAAAVAGGGLIWAVAAARRGQLSIGDIAIFIAAVAGVQSALASLAGEVARAHHALLMFDHYHAVTTVGPDLPVAADPGVPPPLRHGIELRDVWFRYSPEHPWVLRGVDLHIPAGHAVALVGLNGAGKSTVVKLLCRFYDPTRGTILWDGVDLRDLDAAALRQRIGAVFQDYMCYEMTAEENIGLGDPAALGDRERIEGAARRAGVHDTVAALPRGYETLLSRMFFMESDKDNPETGVVLSGGQWQRLALARAFLRDQLDLMILDEPASGLDAEAEHAIHSSLRRHRTGRTSLLISHRLGAVRDADTIVVLSDGQVAEQGNHATLLGSGGEYARLFSLQASGYQPEGHVDR